jgi:urea transport system substrate-binding protein
MAISEASLRDAAVMAVEEINQNGGVMGRQVEAVVEDAASDIPRFRDRAEKLLLRDQVVSIFGCWSSASRKALLPVLEQHNGLLWYPAQYEGNECSSRVVYTGSTPNQQIIPAINWLLDVGRRRLHLVGSDSIFSQTANLIVKRHLQEMSTPVIGEERFPIDERDFAPLTKRILSLRPDVIFSTIGGNSNRSFYKVLHKAGVNANNVPIMAMSVGEAEVRSIGTIWTQGHLATRAYFQTIDTPENQRFIDRFKNRYGDRRVVDDTIEAAYFQVYLWAQAVTKGGSLDPSVIRRNVAGQKYRAPEGDIYVDERNHHTWKTVRVGEIQSDGQFKILHSSAGPIHPDPWQLALYNSSLPHPGC